MYYVRTGLEPDWRVARATHGWAICLRKRSFESIKVVMDRVWAVCEHCGYIRHWSAFMHSKLHAEKKGSGWTASDGAKKEVYDAKQNGAPWVVWMTSSRVHPWRKPRSKSDLATRSNVCLLLWFPFKDSQFSSLCLLASQEDNISPPPPSLLHFLFYPLPSPRPSLIRRLVKGKLVCLSLIFPNRSAVI